MNSKEILWPDKQLTDQIQKAKEIQRRTLSRRPLWFVLPFYMTLANFLVSI